MPRRHAVLATPLVLVLVLVGMAACVREEAQPGESESDSGEIPGVASRRSAPPSAAERRDERDRMVRRQISEPIDGRPRVRSKSVIDALRSVPRHVFVPEESRRQAYADRPLPIGHGQTISQPYIVARMTELLELDATSRVLEVGTGSGYQAAVLAHLTPHVFTVEIVEPLAKRAKETFEREGYDEIVCRHGDGYRGWPEKAPFHRIIVTCAPEDVPPPLWEQLAPGGRLVIPVGAQGEVQRLVVITKSEDGRRSTRTVTYVRFVPLTRDPALEGRTLESRPKEAAAESSGREPSPPGPSED